jgi:hypothetical protein
MPSRVLSVTDGETRPRPWLRTINTDLPYPHTLDQLERRLTEPLRRLGAGDRTVWVPLTAGLDSRLVLALALKVGIRVRTYTNARARLTLADRLLPKRIARAAGVPHAFHRPHQVDTLRAQDYDAHDAGATAGVDRAYYIRRQWDFGRAGDLVLRGGGFEVGRGFYYDRLPPAVGTAVPAATSIAAAFGETASSPAVADLDAWLTAMRADPIPHLDWRDRFYLEQRLCGWLSAIEQALDLTGRERFHVVNAEDTYRILLGLPQDVRRTGQHQRDLIERTAPKLLRFPFNPPDEAFPMAAVLQRLRHNPRGILDALRRRVRLPGRTP